MRSNDYLAIAAHPHLIAAEVGALCADGHGDMLSRVFVHSRDDVYRAFERRLAALMRAEDSVLCMSGYCANVGLLQAIGHPDTPIYIDIRAHASLWEGVKSAGATPRPFRHNDLEHLYRQIRQYGPGIITVDAIYSTSGSIAPLREITGIAEEQACVLVVDETHSFGAQGTEGAGLVAALGLAHRVHFRTIGLSKAAASRGGAVVCSSENADFIRYEAWPLIFSTNVLLHEVAGYNAVLDIFRDEPWRRERLRRLHMTLKTGLEDLGYDMSGSDAQIIAIEAGQEETLLELRDALEAYGVYGSVFCAPATPKNRSLLRLTVNCGLTEEDVARVLSAAAKVRERPGLADRVLSLRRRGRAAPAAKTLSAMAPTEAAE